MTNPLPPLPSAPTLAPAPAPVSALPTPILDLAAQRQTQLAAFLHTPPESLDVDFVHDLRVLTRRVTEVLRLLEPLLDPAISLGIGGALRNLRQAAAELRDLDVLAEHLAQWRLPHPLRLAAAPLQAAFPTRRAALEATLRQTAASTSIQAMLLLLSRVIGDQRLPDRAPAVEAKLAEVLRKRLRRRRDQMENAFGRAAHKQTDKSLHQARITVKKLRYALEIAAAANFKSTRSTLKTLKRLQQLLGTHHDVSVITQTLHLHLTTLATPPSTTATTATTATTLAAPLSPAARRQRATAWRAFLRKTQHAQAHRAAEFFRQSYLWRNTPARNSA